MLGVSLPKADRLSDWLVRPISERQITYALNDVAYLLELRDVLTEKLRALGAHIERVQDVPAAV